MADACAVRQELQMPEKREKYGQERMEFNQASEGIRIPAVTGGLQ